MATTKVSPSGKSNEKTWAIFCHLGGLAGYGFPLGNIIVPLVLWLIKKDEYPLVNDQGKEALNFQISVTIYTIIAGILAVFLIGIPLVIALVVIQIVFVVIAAMKVNEGKSYRYPLTIRFIK